MTWGASPWGARPWADGPAAAAAPSGFKSAWARYANTLIGLRMKKNVSGQAVGCSMVSATDGSAFTGTVTVYVTGDAGTQAIGSVGSGVCTHEGNGFHSYAPAQAETNYDHIAFTFIGSGAVPATVQAYPSFPQTGDAFARIGAAGAGLTAITGVTLAPTTGLGNQTANITGNLSGSVGSVSGAVGSVTGLTASNLDVAVSTRMATYTQPTGFLAATFPGTVASTTNITAASGCTLSATGSAAFTEGYRTDGATGTLAQLLYEIVAHLGESSITSTTKTIKKLDGSTTAATFTLNDAVSPTSITRAT